MQYEMHGFLEQCVDRYLELADVSIDILKTVVTPGVDDHQFTS